MKLRIPTFFIVFYNMAEVGDKIQLVMQVVIGQLIDHVL